MKFVHRISITDPDPDPQKFGKPGPDPNQSKQPDQDQMQEPALMSKSGAEGLTMEVRRLKMEAWRLKMEPWRVCRPVEADSHHFKKELDPDPN